MRKRKISKEERGEGAFELWRGIQENEKERRHLLYTNTVYFMEMKEKQYYKDILGDEEAKWESFLAQPEILYSRNTLYNLERLMTALRKKIPAKVIDAFKETPTGRLIELIPIIEQENENTVLEWIEKAKTLSPQDFRDEIRKVKGLMDSTECPHQHIESFEVCRNCGSRRKKVVTN